MLHVPVGKACCEEVRQVGAKGRGKYICTLKGKIHQGKGAERGVTTKGRVKKPVNCEKKGRQVRDGRSL